jgi:large subunit ribosomal protein L21
MANSPYAVIQTGGKQYLARPGEILPQKAGESVTFTEVLFWSAPGGDALLGRPHLSGAKVVGEIVSTGRGEKIVVGKYKRKKQYRREIGHRQFYTQVIVTEVSNGKGQSETLDAASKKDRLAKFQSHLTPVGGHPVTPKVARPAGEPAAAPKKAPAKKAPAKKASK